MFSPRLPSHAFRSPYVMPASTVKAPMAYGAGTTHSSTPMTAYATPATTISVPPVTTTAFASGPTYGSMPYLVDEQTLNRQETEHRLKKKIQMLQFKIDEKKIMYERLRREFYFPVELSVGGDAESGSKTHTESQSASQAASNSASNSASRRGSQVQHSQAPSQFISLVNEKRS
mmetsp:Transcript_28973/g.76439  ORF Transcript_28973/g.76439 Transcript_28973/m.76439 type:complete len:174 (-) Transcript_28973:199-720(-)